MILVNNHCLEKKVPMMKIAVEAVWRYKCMSHYKNKSRKNTSVA